MIALQMLTVSTRKEVLHVLVRRFMLVMERRAQVNIFSLNRFQSYNGIANFLLFYQLGTLYLLVVLLFIAFLIDLQRVFSIKHFFYRY